MVPLSRKVELRFVLMEYGVVCVAVDGTEKHLQWCVDN